MSQPSAATTAGLSTPSLRGSQELRADARLAAETLVMALDDGHQGLVYDVGTLKIR
jgi:hypothetical protein